MGTSKSLSVFALFLTLAAAPSSALALRLNPLLAQSITVDPVFSLPDSVESGTSIKIGSSSTLAGVNEVLEQRFENQYSGTKVEVDYTSSDEAIAALENGDIDIAAIGRPLTEAEKAQGFTEVMLGRHKIAIIVSEENSFSGDVTTPQFAQIFRGEITDWSELEGGAPGAIRLVDRPESSDTRQAFSNYPVFKEAPFATGSTASALDTDSTEAVVGELGTDGMGFAIAEQAVNRPGIRILSMHKVLPTNPAYPFSQPLSYVYKGDASPAVQAFLGYATDPSTAGVLDEAKKLGAEATFGGFQGQPNLDAAAVAGLVGSAAVANPDAAPADADSAAGAEGQADGAATAPAEADGAATADGSAEANGAATEGAATADGSAEADGAATEGAATAGKFPWWLLWLLGIPILGALLWWLLNRRSDDNNQEVPPVVGVKPAAIATGAAVAGAAAVGAGALAAFDRDKNRMVLVPRDSQSGYAYWEVEDETLASLRKEGGQDFGLRLYDVTGRDADAELPKPLQQLTVDPEDSDRNLTIPTPDRDYLAEVGYTTASAKWLPAARSAPVHIAEDLPAFSSLKAPTVTPPTVTPPTVTPPTVTTPKVGTGMMAGLKGVSDGIQGAAKTAVDSTSTVAKTAADGVGDGVSATGKGIKGSVVAGAAGVAAVAAGTAGLAGKAFGKTDKAKAGNSDRLILVPRDGKNAYAYWEISPEKKAAMKQQGGEKLALRLYDVTGINPREEKPHSVQQFDCNEQEQDLHVTVPTANRAYLADLGYTTADGKWLRLAHAAPVQVPSSSSDDSTPSGEGGSDPFLTPSGTTGSGATEKGKGLNFGGMVDGLKAKAGDAVQSGKDVVGSGQNTVSKMGQSIVDTGASAGQAVADGTVKAGQSVVSGGKKFATGTTGAVATAVAGTAAAGTAVASTVGRKVGSATTQDVNIVLVPRTATAAYTYWEMTDGMQKKLADQNVKALSLRIHEVTDMDLDFAPAHSTQIFECKLTDRDRHVPIPVEGKDYLAELGYTMPGGRWVSLARSLHVRVA